MATHTAVFKGLMAEASAREAGLHLFVAAGAYGLAGLAEEVGVVRSVRVVAGDTGASRYRSVNSLTRELRLIMARQAELLSGLGE